MAGRQEKYLAKKKKEQQRELGARGTVAAVKSYMSSDGTGPYGVRSVSCFRGAHWRPCVCACVQLWSPSSLSHGFLSLTSPFYPACRAGNKVNKHGGVVGPPSFTPKTKQCPHQTPLHIRTKARSMGRRHGALWHTRSNVSFRTSKPDLHRQNKRRLEIPLSKQNTDLFMFRKCATFWFSFIDTCVLSVNGMHELRMHFNC